MLSFLPNNNRKKIIIEYLSRISIVFLSLLFLAILLLTFLFIPSAIFSKYNYKTVKNQYNSINGAGLNKSQDPIGLIKRVNAITEILSNKGTEPVLISEMIAKIISLKNKDIKILSILISKDSLISGKIIVDGIANTRNALTLFDKDLKSDGLFDSVDLPVSNLIKNIDAPFTIKLIYNKK